MITHGGGLPAETSRFFGRSQEAAVITGALASSRLVTLTGPGGIGKTRLAVTVVSELAQAFPDGVFIADLSAARDAAGVARALATALGVPHQEAQQDPCSWLASQLHGKHLLVILDTCEYVIEACAALADAILRGGGPVLMVTSRRPLGLPGEVVFRIPPLTVTAAEPDGGDAVRLFADRAAAAVPGFELTQDALPKAVRLCRLLDGVPLAIELAALRLRAIGLDELLARCPGHLRLLGGGRRAATADRQQSLQASVTWSYDLCTPPERLLWSRLSVFADGFDLAAAEEVCSGGELGVDTILDTLVGLVDKSVVLRAADTGGVARYRLLAVVREHGAEHAADAGDCAVRHRDYYLGVARAFAASFVGPGQLGLVMTLARDDANLRAAFEAALAAGDAAMALEFAIACWPGQVCAGRLAEAESWLARAVKQDQEQINDPERVHASAPAAPLRQLATRLAVWGLAAQGDRQTADALRAKLPAAGQATEATRILPLIAGLDGAFGALRRGAFADCGARCDDLAASLPAGERWARGWAAWVKGLAGWFAGDRVVAGVRLRAGLELLAPFGGEQAVALHLEAFAWLAAGHGDFRRTARLQGAADRIWQRLAAREGVKAPRFGLPLLHAERDRAERQARDALSAAGYAAEHTAGAALSTEAAIRNAMPGPPSSPQPLASHISGPGEARQSPVYQSPAHQVLAPQSAGFASPPTSTRTGPESAPTDPDAAFAGRWELLTTREREVAGLVATGLTNKDIAARLVVSKRTVDAHLEHILGKLGYSSRVQVAALASHERDRQHRERERQRREQSGREQEGREQAGREQAGREQEGREQEGREQAGREEAGREQEGREQAHRQEEGREQTGREQADRAAPGQTRRERPPEPDWPVPAPHPPRESGGRPPGSGGPGSGVRQGMPPRGEVQRSGFATPE